MNEEVMKTAADNIRVLAASMVEKAQSGHPGGAMGGADFINMLYSAYLVYDPDDPTWFARDRFFLDPGHMSPMLYSVLALTGKFTMEELKKFRQWDSVTPGHPELNPERGIENTSGPLGQGHTMAVGCAIAERFLHARFGDVVSHKTYAFISDGGIQEEISQGAGRIAGHLGLSNLIMFYDSNGVQLSTNVEDVDCEDVATKYRAWHWNVLEIDGSDPCSISAALECALAEKEKPTLIIGRTIMGRGCVTSDGSSFEGKCSTHGQPLSKSGADFNATLLNLGGNPDNPFRIWDAVINLYAARKEKLHSIVAERRREYDEWAFRNPELDKELRRYLSGKLPDIDWASISQKDNDATRNASASVLSVLAKHVGNMIVSSADLANSDKTDGFLKETSQLRKNDFSGAFLQAGVSELTMASIMNGIALHGGVICACGTFFVFSDYMKPAVRLAALMELPVKYIWTHDAFRVGEDGPTHEPVEQEAQIRLMEELHNLSGNPSMLVLRPADSAETTVAWKMAMENSKTPTALILSRQNIKNLPAKCSRYEEALKAEKGAYVVIDCPSPDMILIANGSEVSLLCEVSERLLVKHIHTRVISIPSIGLFNEQSIQYKKELLPPGIPVFGLTAGLPSTLKAVAGACGSVFGLSRFGASAPYKTLDEKFGFTVENIMNEILKQISK